MKKRSPIKTSLSKMVAKRFTKHLDSAHLSKRSKDQSDFNERGEIEE